MVGIDRLSWDRTGKPLAVSIARWASDRPVWGIAAGDFDGDGHLDLVYARAEPHEVVVLLNNGKGDFRRAGVEGLVRPANTTYDIRVADVDRDGRPDIVMMFESRSDAPGSNGSIRVFLNRTHLARKRSRP